MASLTEANAIAVASLKASAIGALIVSAVLAFNFGLIAGTASLGSAVSAAIAGYIFAFIFGAICTAFCLMLVGLPIAAITSHVLRGKMGLVVAFTTAFAACAALALLLGNAGVALAVIPFAFPAAYFYRSEILLEHSLN